jgi:hypothetical protein
MVVDGLNEKNVFAGEGRLACNADESECFVGAEQRSVTRILPYGLGQNTSSSRRHWLAQVG